MGSSLLEAARFLARTLTLSLSLCVACEGRVSEPAGPALAGGGAAEDQAPGGPGGTQALAALEASGSRRLTRAEYAASVHALLGSDAPVHTDLLPIDSSSPFDNLAYDQVASLALVEAVDSQADELARWAVATPERQRAVVDCSPGGPDDAQCFSEFVARFGRRAFRRPLLDSELAAFASFATISSEDADFFAGVRYALAAFLSHPSFLYRLEGASLEAGEHTLDDYELATRLAYFLTGAGPDDALLDAAGAGLASDVELVRESAERLLASPPATAHLARFHAMWLGYDRFALEGLYGAMRRESDALVRRAAFDDVDYFELFTSRETWLDPQLAAHYEIASAPPAEGGWVALDDAQRAGILGHASVLSASSNSNDTSPTRRGQFVRERLLCNKVPPPPPGVDSDNPPAGSPDACKEERYAEHRTRSECAGCHRLMDPIGFGLERFDKLGKLRTHDDGRPECGIAGRGEIAGVASFEGPAQLGRALVDSGQLEACVTEHVLGYALGRLLDGSNERDRDAVRSLSTQFEREGRRMHALLLAVVTSSAFRTRWDGATP